MRDDTFSLWSTVGIVDKVSLVQQLYDAYEKTTDIGTIVHITNQKSNDFVRISPNTCGFVKNETIEEFVRQRIFSLIKKKGNPLRDKTMGTDIYYVSIDWDLLNRYAGLLHDMEADRPYGQFKQKKLLKELILESAGIFSGKEMIISEKILGKYLDHVSIAQKIRGEDSLDHNINFIATLKNLEKDGFLAIINTIFDFSTFPKVVEEEVDRLEAGVFIHDEAYFYPAEHCQVTVRIKQPSRPTVVSTQAITFSEDLLREQNYESEVEFISKLLQICNPSTQTVELVFPSEKANNDPIRAGYDNGQMLIDLDKSYGVLSIVDQSTDIITEGQTGIVKVKINYQKLLERAENLHDEIESWKGIVLGIEEQKRRILDKLQDRFRKNPQMEYEYSEWLLGPYVPRNEDSPLGFSLSNPDPNRTDIRYQFMKAMRGLESDGHFKIVSVKINFMAQPEPTHTSLEANKWSLGERNLEFIPAKHCKVTLRPITTTPILKISEFPLPEDVEWMPGENKHVLSFKEGQSLKFINLEKPTAKYFKLLIENHGQEVKHKKVRELIRDITKTQIENLVKALRKKVKNAKLSNRIKFVTYYEGGYTLIISPKK